jgi:hypothetical protein
MHTTDPLLLLLHNWSRWCRSTGDCLAAGYKTATTFEDMALPYKVLITETEALDDIETHSSPHEPSAIRVEQWVVQLPDPPRTAIRVHWVHIPDSVRHELGLTFDQLQERRARFASRSLHRHIRLADYEREVGEGMAILRECLA